MSVRTKAIIIGACIGAAAIVLWVILAVLQMDNAWLFIG